MQKGNLHREFDDTIRLCWRVAVLAKYGHFEDAAQEVRSADFLDLELKQIVCQCLKSEKQFPASLVLDPFVRRICAQQG
jgi:hypothetical protein